MLKHSDHHPDQQSHQQKKKNIQEDEGDAQGCHAQRGENKKQNGGKRYRSIDLIHNGITAPAREMLLLLQDCLVRLDFSPHIEPALPADLHPSFQLTALQKTTTS